MKVKKIEKIHVPISYLKLIVLRDNKTAASIFIELYNSNFDVLRQIIHFTPPLEKKFANAHDNFY